MPFVWTNCIKNHFCHKIYDARSLKDWKKIWRVEILSAWNLVFWKLYRFVLKHAPVSNFNSPCPRTFILELHHFNCMLLFLQIITAGGVTYRNEPWHRECFCCTNCSSSLAGQRFTSRDEKPYCAECFGELFAKKCTACNKPITGKFFHHQIQCYYWEN